VRNAALPMFFLCSSLTLCSGSSAAEVSCQTLGNRTTCQTPDVIEASTAPTFMDGFAKGQQAVLQARQTQLQNELLKQEILARQQEIEARRAQLTAEAETRNQAKLQEMSAKREQLKKEQDQKNAATYRDVMQEQRAESEAALIERNDRLLVELGICKTSENNSGCVGNTAE
jgi:hypothetical protein